MAAKSRKSKQVILLTIRKMDKKADDLQVPQSL